MKHLIAAIVFAPVFTFVLLNVVVQCDSWGDPACVTPTQFVGFFIP